MRLGAAAGKNARLPVFRFLPLAKAMHVFRC